MAAVIPKELVVRCREAVFTAASAYEVAPVLITAHYRSKRADNARSWVMRYMVESLGMRRHQVALIFGRDLRRVRKSVLGV